MKIGFDAKRLFNNFTGLGNYSRTLVRNIQQTYPENEYHLFSPKIQNNSDTAFFLESDKFIIHKPSVKYRPFWRSHAITSLCNTLALDIYHGLSHELPLNAGHMTAKKVVSFHDLIYEKYPQQYSYWDRMTYRMKYRRSVNLADKIVCISKSTKNDLVSSYGVNEDKCEVIYQSCGEGFVPLRNSDHDRPYLLYVGSVIERKGLLSVVQAIGKIAEGDRPKCVVIGGGGSYKMRVLSEVKRQRLQANFVFLENVPNRDLASIYQHATALIYPSTYEGFGIPLIESLSCMTPVITTDISSLPEAAGPGALYVESNNIEQLSQAILKITTDARLRSNLGQSGYQYVQESFNPSKLSQQLMAVYQSLL